MNPPTAISTGIKPMAVIYLRVSTKDQANRGGEAEGFSIPAQREACLRKAEAIGAVVVAEFVDAGESARSANRPELKNMLAFVKEHRVAHVIVHKVDRLARNRVDDVEINLQLSSVGAQLVSCSENIDETPSGMLLHGIMSSIAEFYSRNLATESKKGMRQKAKNGGTPGMAPFGYINTRARTENGREIRTVALDPERSPWVRWIYERYATGEWTVPMIRDELVKRGVTTLPRPNRPSRPIAISHIYSILKNRYYVGMVIYEGVEYRGTHPALIDEALFETAQRIRTARHESGEKPRIHTHYLKGSVYCGQCGEPLTFGQSRNRVGNLYDYFYCLGRHRSKSSCTFRAIQSHQLEAAIENHWRTVTLRPSHVKGIRKLILDHMRVVLPDSSATRAQATEQLAKLERDSLKVLDAFYANAIDTPELRNEQVRIAAERAAAEQIVDSHQHDEKHLTNRLEYCLSLLSSAHAHYQQADDNARRELNQAVFEHLYVHDDEIVGSDLTPAFQRLMSDQLDENLARERKREETAHIPTSDLWTATEVTDALNRGRKHIPHDLPSKARRTAPEDRSGGILTIERPRGHLPWEKTNHGPRKDRGLDQSTLVAGTGFEPATSGL